MDAMPSTNSTAGENVEQVAGDHIGLKDRILETGAGALQSFAPLTNICAHLNAFHTYASAPGDRFVETNHYCAHLTHNVRQCILYDSPHANARLIGIEYMITADLYATLDETERRLWHSHVFEVKSGMLIMPAGNLTTTSSATTSSAKEDKKDEQGQEHHPAGSVLSGLADAVKSLGPQQTWEAAETTEMEGVVNLYGKIYHLWQTDRGDKLPLGEPQLMTSFTEAAQFPNFEEVVGERDGRMGGDWRRKREMRAYIGEPDVHRDADWAWKERRKSL